MDSLFPQFPAPPGLAALQRPIHRAIADLKAGAPVAVEGAASAVLGFPADCLSDDQLLWLRGIAAPRELSLVITARRARALDLKADRPVALRLAPGVNAASILALATAERRSASLDLTPAGETGAAMVELAKLARRLPSAVIAEMPPEASVAGVTRVLAADVAACRAALAQSLKCAGEARVPLAGGDARFVVFEDVVGSTHTAIVVGEPRPGAEVRVRVHSSCFTGDLFGSKRCDCGDQLHLALRRIQEAGSGVLLYLDQEGRGIGLANKMHAYRLQDGGLDTVDANHRLGFEDDERDYEIAARMLAMLGIERIIVLTNNPTKIGGLERHGITVAGRLPLLTRPTSHNARYLATKARRSGHDIHYPNSVFTHVP